MHGTVASNVQTLGTGALNVDGCRVESGHRPIVVSDSRSGNVVFGDGLQGSKAVGETDAGRWPANVVLDDEAAAALDEQTEHQMHGAGHARDGREANVSDKYAATSYHMGANRAMHRFGDSGGASRFFYTAKASAEDRGRWQGNDHPTVKPTDLMLSLIHI